MMIDFYQQLVREIEMFGFADRPVTVGVTGGRDYDDIPVIGTTIAAVRNTLKVGFFIHGNACGLDRMAGQAAIHHRMPIRLLPALWKSEKKAAGPLRNNRMRDILKDAPDRLLIAFPGGSGTLDMINKCRDTGIPILDVCLILDKLN